MTSTRLQSVNPLVVMLLGPGFTRKWESLRQCGSDPHPAVKMGVGLCCLGAGLLVWAFGLTAFSGLISAGWLVGMYVFHSIGELLFEPVGQKFVLANSPQSTKAFYLAVWDAAEFAAYLVGAELAHLFQNPRLYWILGIVAIGAGTLLVKLRKRLASGEEHAS
jgi:POT family proton-dependent oligopeptide transporter